jgi:hypothetical protein
MKITLGMVVLNRKDEVIENLRRTCPYVDRTIIVDGGSEDGLQEWLFSDEARQLGVEPIVHKQVRMQYGNHTPTERNIYLNQMETGSGNWALVLDSDEFLEEEALKSLHSLAERAEKTGGNSICFQAHDIWTYADGRVYDNVAEYWHHSMFFKCVPGMTYQGHTHAGVHRPGIPYRAIKSPLQYEHRKTELQMWKSSCYLWWTTSKTAQNVTTDPVWLAFHSMMKRHGYLDWHVFKKVMDKGTVADEIKQWFIDHRDDANPEAAAWFVHYFVNLHPEQNTNKLNSDTIYKVSWDYVLNERTKTV